MTTEVPAGNLSSKIEALQTSGARILSVSVGRYGKYVIDYATPDDERYSELQRLRFLEHRIKVYPELYRAVKAAIEYDNYGVERHVKAHLEAVGGNSQQSRPEQEPRHDKP